MGIIKWLRNLLMIISVVAMLYVVTTDAIEDILEYREINSKLVEIANSSSSIMSGLDVKSRLSDKTVVQNCIVLYYSTDGFAVVGGIPNKVKDSIKESTIKALANASIVQDISKLNLVDTELYNVDLVYSKLGTVLGYKIYKYIVPVIN